MKTNQIIAHIAQLFQGFETRQQKIDGPEVGTVLNELVNKTDITFGQSNSIIEYINDKVHFYKELIIEKFATFKDIAVDKLFVKKFIKFDEDEHIVIALMDDTLAIGQPGALKPCKISIEGNTVVKNDLTVIGHLYLNSIKVENLAQFKDDLFVDKDLHVHKDVRIGGKLYVPQFEIEDEFIVDNDFTVHGDLRVDGTLSVDTIDLEDNLRARKLTLYNPDDEDINTELIVKYDETDDINRLYTEGLYINATNGIRFDSENDVNIFYSDTDEVLHLTTDTTINGYIRANSIKIGSCDITYDTQNNNLLILTDLYVDGDINVDTNITNNGYISTNELHIKSNSSSSEYCTIKFNNDGYEKYIMINKDLLINNIYCSQIFGKNGGITIGTDGAHSEIIDVYAEEFTVHGDALIDGSFNVEQNGTYYSDVYKKYISFGVIDEGIIYAVEITDYLERTFISTISQNYNYISFEINDDGIRTELTIKSNNISFKYNNTTVSFNLSELQALKALITN